MDTEPRDDEPGEDGPRPDGPRWTPPRGDEPAVWAARMAEADMRELLRVDG